MKADTKKVPMCVVVPSKCGKYKNIVPARAGDANQCATDTQEGLQSLVVKSTYLYGGEIPKGKGAKWETLQLSVSFRKNFPSYFVSVAGAGKTTPKRKEAAPRKTL
jgi:hypothetical protein